MLVALIVLTVLLAAALAAVGWLVFRTPEWLGTRWPQPDPAAARAFDRTPGPPVAAGTTRRLITIEILNTGELAGSRGRLAGLAHAVVPGLTRRVVYDQTVKILHDQLRAQHVDADVRVHTIRPNPGSAARGTGTDPQTGAADTVVVLDLGDPRHPTD